MVEAYKSKDGSIVKAIQFKITEQIPCKYGIAKKDNSMDIAMLVHCVAHVNEILNGDRKGELAMTIQTPLCKVGVCLYDYVVINEDGTFDVYEPIAFKEKYSIM